MSEIARVYKFTGYVVDYNDDFEGVEAYIDYLSDEDRYCSGIKVFSYEESDEFEWDDDISINMVDCP